MSNRQDPRTPGDRDVAAAPSGPTFVRSTFGPGDLICDRFRVVRFIARGGMGELYEAEDLELGERVALKTIRPEIAADERVNQRFRREVQLARKVTHPNICRIFDLFQHAPAAGPAVAFVTMELLEGETLAARLKRHGRIDVEQAIPMVRQMAAALSAAHAVGIVHRDFKSNNVMLLAARDSEPPRVVVTDFGLAYSLTDDTVASGGTISVAGEILGTPDYMAPEQIEGALVTPATDVYALGIVLYEMVTGVRPFVADTPVASALRRISGPPAKPPRELVPDLPPIWDQAIVRCLARYPANRFADASAVLEALDPQAAATNRWRSRAALIGTAAAVVVMTLAGAIAWRPPDRPVAETRAASVAPLTGARPAVAVLGFKNLAGRDDTEWLSVALAEMLTTELGAGDALRTIPGENINRMKMELALSDADSYAAETLRRIRDNLGTDLVVLGSYVTVGDGGEASLRIDIRLQDSREGRTVSLVSETGRAVDLLDVVSRAGRRLRERLGVEVKRFAGAQGASQRPPAADAVRLYAEGLMRLRSFDALGARERFERAIQADPDFSLAHTAMASAWSALGYDNRARDAAERAFEVSAALPRADRLVVEGTYREMASEWAEAIGIWQTLLTLYPDDIEHTLRLANAQIASGGAKDGLATIDAFRRRFPSLKDPRLDLAEAAAAETVSDFKRAQRAAAAAGAAGTAQGARLLVASAKLREGTALLRMGQADEAAALFDMARRSFKDAGDHAGEARAINNLASALADGPQTDRVMALYEEGLGTARKIGEQDLVARFLNNLAIQYRRAGDLQASLRMNQESLAIRREIGDRTNTSVSLNNIGNVLLDMGDLKGASEHYEQSAAMSREIGDRRSEARALFNAAEALKLQGKLPQARAAADQALSIRRGIDDPAGVATSLVGVGQIVATQGDLAAARRHLGEGLEMDRRLNRQRPIAYSLFYLGEIALMAGDVADARRRHQEALDIRTGLGEKGTAAESRTALAILSYEEGRFADAEALAREAAMVFGAQAAADNEAMARAVMALALAAQNRPEPARGEADRARALVRETSNVLVRLPVEIAAAWVESLRDPAAASRRLEVLRAEAAGRGLPRYEFDARRALARIDGRSPAGAARAAALKKDARARGFGLYAR